MSDSDEDLLLSHLHASQEVQEGQRWLADEEDAPPQLFQTIFTVVVLVIMFSVLITDRVGTDSVMLTALTAFYMARIIDIKEALLGFSSKGLLTVMVLFVVAEGKKSCDVFFLSRGTSQAS